MFTAEDINIPVDKSGLVIYFSVKGNRFFFNGNTGFLSHDLPDYADAVFGALKKSNKEKRRIWKTLEEQFGSNCRSLIQEITLFQNGRHPSLAVEPRQKAFLPRTSPTQIVIYTSQDCNLACSYCYNQGGTFGGPSSFMSTETAQDVVSFISGIIKEERHDMINVNLFGGEPLLNLPAVKIFARRLQDLNHLNLKSKVRLTLATNGTIYNKEIFKTFAERPDLSTIVVSLDAFRNLHDLNRVFKNKRKRSSYDVVLANLKRLIKEGIPHSVTCVVTHPFDFVSAAGELHKLGLRCVELRDLTYHIFGEAALPEVFYSNLALWKQKYLEYSDFHLDYMAKENAVEHVDRNMLVLKYADVLENSGEAGDTLACGAGDSSIAIDSSGSIFPCDGFIRHHTFKLGHVKDGFDKAKHKCFEQWILSNGQHRIDNGRCRLCFAKLFCAGGCYAHSYDKNHRLAPLDENRCEYIRETIKIDLYYLSEMKRRGLKLRVQLADEASVGRSSQLQESGDLDFKKLPKQEKDLIMKELKAVQRIGPFET
ncbi:MAG: radical SAM protein [Deltaproteobacteria bacterium]|nr:radical SAM protein [Deltaproteobacteria bacterium]